MEAPVVTFVAEPQSAEYPESESQSAPELATDHEARNRTLRWKLRNTVGAANGCAHAMAREQGETREKVRKLEWALLIERAAHQRREDNPMGTQLMPTTAEVRARMTAEDEKKAQEEHRRQAQVERDLQQKLAQTIERERKKECRDREVQEKKAESARFSTSLEKLWPQAAVQAAVKALAVSRGRELPKFADFRDCHRVGPPAPRQ